jgi:Uncharacterized protein family UPF0016
VLALPQHYLHIFYFIICSSLCIQNKQMCAFNIYTLFDEWMALHQVPGTLFHSKHTCTHARTHAQDRTAVFTGTFGALAIMTVISVALGQARWCL